AYAATKTGEWENHKYLGLDIAGRTLGIIGAGKIGRMVVERALALRMRVLVHDPYLSEELARQLGAELVELDTLLSRSDFISLHVPLNLETEGLIGEEALNKVKRGCHIINCAVGRLVDEQALATALRDGRVAGAALDVFANQPPGKDHPLLHFDQVICTPHMRASTRDAQVNVTVQTAHQIIDFLQKGIIVNAINVPSINAEMRSFIRPYAELAERLGAFQAQRCARRIKEITVEYAGNVTSLPLEILTMCLLKGFLTPIIGPMVNFVNAAQRTRERGIRVIEAKSGSAEGFTNSIRLTVTGEDGIHSATGAVFAADDFRIVRVDDYHVETIPEGYMLILHNNDRPGVIGFVGQTLAQAGINIALMNLSRRKIQGKAISLINVDSRIPDPLLDALRNSEHILSAVQVKL
ncbi:MAG: NAD(P)-dependent oxidoreductase, partial [Desulfuromonadaceae bacterium]